jgi:N-methylhydantoinase B
MIRGIGAPFVQGATYITPGGRRWQGSVRTLPRLPFSKEEEPDDVIVEVHVAGDVLSHGEVEARLQDPGGRHDLQDHPFDLGLSAPLALVAIEHDLDAGRPSGEPVGAGPRRVRRQEGLDTTGSAKQCKGNVNCGFPNTVSAARLALAFLFPSGEPEVNHGSFLPLKVVAEPGSVFAANAPAACRHPHPGMLMLDLVIKALAPVLPENVAAGLPGDSWNVFVMGQRPETGAFLVSGEALDGGWGACAKGDGESALIHSAAGDFPNVPVETLEGRFPIRVRSFRLGRDSGGPGRFRGGLNVIKEYEVETDCRLTLHFDRALTPQWGLFGGGEGGRSKVTLLPADGSPPRELLKIEQLPLKKGDRFICETGGGGGYGNPRDRDPERVKRDLFDGYVSREAAQKVYGFRS